ncbi:MAG: tRNA threonylcarbamoyladenosine dehydratase [Clostridiales bacterium]|nr:tRNA threonylcarbamoyladenosine dehydratase [Clostridiales bacterium]
MIEFSRSALLLGEEAIARLHSAHVALFGVGGVGGACAEALARGGVGHITLVDDDTVSLSNINRQTAALHSTVGRPKVQVMKERILDINPQARVDALQLFFREENAADFDFTAFNYVVDAIDTVSAKVCLIERAHRLGVPIISALGAGNKLDPTRFRAADIYETTVCPLARVMRSQLKKRGIAQHRVVYSTEPPLATKEIIVENGRHLPGSLSFVPPVMGMILAGEVIKDLCGL